jgi:hypothetical protein
VRGPAECTDPHPALTLRGCEALQNAQEGFGLGSGLGLGLGLGFRLWFGLEFGFGLGEGLGLPGARPAPTGPRWRRLCRAPARWARPRTPRGTGRARRGSPPRRPAGGRTRSRRTCSSAVSWEGRKDAQSPHLHANQGRWKRRRKRRWQAMEGSNAIHLLCWSGHSLIVLVRVTLLRQAAALLVGGLPEAALDVRRRPLTHAHALEPPAAPALALPAPRARTRRVRPAARHVRQRLQRVPARG